MIQVHSKLIIDSLCSHLVSNNSLETGDDDLDEHTWPVFSDDQLQVLLASSAPPVTTDDRKHGLLCCDHLERDKTLDHDALLSTGVVTRRLEKNVLSWADGQHSLDLDTGTDNSGAHWAETVLFNYVRRR